MPTGGDAIVLDASAFVRAETETTAGAIAARERIATATAHAPHLIVAEVGNVARRLTARGTVSAERGLALVTGADEGIDRLYTHGSFVPMAWLLRANVTFYDGLYVALAATLALPLLTADARLARAPGLPCVVELVE
jgi:predicted nucleic acid-binding protein